MHRVIITSIVAATLFCFAAGWGSTQLASSAETPAASVGLGISNGSQSMSKPKTRSGFGGGSVPVYVSDTWRQSVSFGQWRPSPSEFAVIEKTFDAQTATWSASTFVYSAAFDIELVVGADKNLFFLKGKASSGDDVIQKWKRKLIAFQQQTYYIILKTELYRGSTLGDISGLNADPEGRFVLLLHGSPLQISKLDLASGFNISTLYASTDIPHLLTNPYLIAPRNHISSGRVWKILGDSTRYRTLLFDQDYDGNFESWQTYTAQDYTNLYPLDDWTDDFLHH